MPYKSKRNMRNLTTEEKSAKHLFKTKKGWMNSTKIWGVTVAGIAFSSFLVANVGLVNPVSADVVTQSQTQVTNTAVAVPEAQADQVKAQSAKDDAQTKSDQANQAVQTAQADVTAKTQTVDSAQKVADEAPTHIAQAQTDVDNQTPVANEAQAKADNTQTAEKVAQATVDTADANLAQVTQTEKSAQAAVDNNQADQNKANTTISDDQNQISTAKSQVVADKAKQADNAQKIDDLTNTAKNDQAQIGKATDELNSAKQTQAKAQTDYNNALNQNNADKSAVQADQNAMNNDSAQSTIKLPDTSVWNEAKPTTQQGWDERTKKLKQWDSQGSALNENGFVLNPKDLINIDVNNLTSEQKLEIDDFYGNLINQIRQQDGMHQVVVGGQSMDKFADEVAANYDKDSWDIIGNKAGAGHDVSAITAAAKTVGLTDSQGNIYENLSAGYLGMVSNPGTLAGYKEAIYDTVVSMLFKDASAHYGHTISLLGVSDWKYGFTDAAISIDHMGQIHLLGADLSNIKSDYNRDTKTGYMGHTSNVVDPAKWSSVGSHTPVFGNNPELAKQLAADQAKEAQSAQLINTTQSALNSANQDVATKQAKLDSLNPANVQQQINDLQNENDSLANDINLNNSKVASLETDIQNAQNKLAQLQAQAPKLVSDLNDAKSAVSAARTVADQANKALATVKANNQSAQADAKAQANKLAAYQAVLSQYQNADKDLQAAKDVQVKAEQALKDLQASQATAHETLETAQANLDQANQVLKNALAKQAVDDAEKAAQAEKDKQATQLPNSNMGHNAEVTSDQTIGHNGTVTTGSPLTSTSTDKAKSASVAETLPQTGTSVSNSFMALIGMLLLSLVSILGLGKLNKKRN